MRNNKRDLWKRLYEYNFEHLVPARLWDQVVATFGGTDASTRAFAQKLVTKLNWRLDVALRTIEEYKRFVYLGLTADFDVTPPAAIDKVWHQHQQFTKGYRDFCSEVLGQNFDHYPELLPHQEQTDQFNVQYYATLRLYEREFGVRPPEDIWGKPKFSLNELSKRPPAVYSKKKRKTEDEGSVAVITDNDTPLFQLFPSSDPVMMQCHESPPASFHGQGGHSGGAGATSSWDTSPTDPSPSHGGHDAGGGNVASAPSCSASSCSASSCSSSGCGGGGE